MLSNQAVNRLIESISRRVLGLINIYIIIWSPSCQRNAHLALLTLELFPLLLSFEAIFKSGLHSHQERTWAEGE